MRANFSQYLTSTKSIKPSSPPHLTNNTPKIGYNEQLEIFWRPDVIYSAFKRMELTIGTKTRFTFMIRNLFSWSKSWSTI